MTQKKYFGIDWLRAIACISIAIMHIRANTSYEISGFLYNKAIPSMTHFVYLFMAISAFGMCCGYYDKVMNGKVNWTSFYQKRYMKILPFFALLIGVDVIMSFSISSLLEGLSELTLLYGFIPQELSVIGVSWYLGTVFVFYLIFPFFCVLIENKPRAWTAFIVSVVLHYICSLYFNLNRHNILFSLCYFLVGGLVYLYKDQLEKIKAYIYIPILVITLAVFLSLKKIDVLIILLSFIMLSFAISIKDGYSKIISFISGISMEIYLSHMVIFRVVEKLKLHQMIGNGWLQYLLTCCLVIFGAICFSYIAQTIISKVQSKFLISK